MFTGIIQGKGKVVSLRAGKKGGELILSTPVPLKNLKRGESIAVDGCCLTLTSKKQKNLFFDLSDETIRKTKIETYQKGTVVNLERAMKASDRLGGHFVLGHVDGVGKIDHVKRNAGSLEIDVSFPKKFARYLIDKGSVAVDGVSLTACLTRGSCFKVFIVPLTSKLTNLTYKKVGDLVNLEGDVLGKYVERLILPQKR